MHVFKTRLGSGRSRSPLSRDVPLILSLPLSQDRLPPDGSTLDHDERHWDSDDIYPEPSTIRWRLDLGVQLPSN
jgi:hypothetical protein